jgi:hypothetical protein
MLGLGDFSIFSVYILCILSVIACVIYGIVNWHKGTDKDQDQLAQEWQKTEADIVEKLDI